MSEHIAKPVAEPEKEHLSRRTSLRHALDRVSVYADWLPDQDRILIRAYIDDGRSAIELSRLIGVCPRTVQRRLLRITSRMLSPRFVFVGSRLSRLGPTRREVARCCVLAGHSLREASRRLRLSMHAVRSHLDAIEAMCERVEVDL